MYRRFLPGFTAFLLLIAGCTSKPIETTMPTESRVETIPTTPTEATTLPEYDVTQQPMLALSMPIRNERDADGDVVICEHVYQEVNLILPEADIAERIISDFKTKASAGDTAQQISQWATEAYTDTSENWNRYLCEVTYTPMRFDASVLSFFGTHAYYADVYMSDGFNKAVTYDVTTGLPVKLSTVLTKISRDELVQLVNDALANLGSDIALFDEYPDVVKQRFSGSLAQEEDWYFGNDGLYFFFSPYEIAPRSSGVISVCIPYEKLAGKMDDAYFPPEQEATDGIVEALEFNDTSVEQFSQYAEVILQEGGRKSLLFTNLSVTNVRIEVGHYDSDIFTPQYTIFSTPILTPGDAVMLEYGENDIDSIRLTYHSSGEEHHCRLGPNNTLIFED